MQKLCSFGLAGGDPVKWWAATAAGVQETWPDLSLLQLRDKTISKAIVGSLGSNFESCPESSGSSWPSQLAYLYRPILGSPWIRR